MLICIPKLCLKYVLSQGLMTKNDSPMSALQRGACLPIPFYHNELPIQLYLCSELISHEHIVASCKSLNILQIIERDFSEDM